jgi:hypothetical protein
MRSSTDACDGVLPPPQVLVPLMLAVFFAKLVGDALGLSVYDTHIKIKGAPVLVSTPKAEISTTRYHDYTLAAASHFKRERMCHLWCFPMSCSMRITAAHAAPSTHAVSA